MAGNHDEPPPLVTTSPPLLATVPGAMPSSPLLLPTAAAHAHVLTSAAAPTFTIGSASTSSATSPAGSSEALHRPPVLPPRRTAARQSADINGERMHATSRLAQTTAHVRETARSLSRINLTWEQPPQQVLVIKKYKDEEVAQLMIKVVLWMIEQRKLVVFVEEAILEEDAFKRFADHERTTTVAQLLRPWSPDVDIDFVVTLGGDGTVLYAASLFQAMCPPVMAFHLGSLGFLTCFDFNNFQLRVGQVIEGRARINMRMRLSCQVEYMEFDTANKGRGAYVRRAEHTYQALNEMVVDRGTSSYIAQLELYVEDELITTVNADGLIIATPTGSTAYSLSAGGAITHPSVPCILVTPICPHTLSFRPLLLPDSVELRVVNPIGSRNSAWASFDGRNRVEIKQGDAIRLRASQWPVPTVCLSDTTTDWFESLSRCLNWNVREPQRSFNQSGLSLEEMQLQHRRSLSRVGVASRPPSTIL